MTPERREAYYLLVKKKILAGLSVAAVLVSAFLAGLAIVLAVYVAQVVVSRLWLDRFRYGPIEWLWRALMYGRAPPFRKA